LGTKVVDVDILRTDTITGLDGYDAVEILFRRGRDPVGRARVRCDGDPLKVSDFVAEFADLEERDQSVLPDASLPTVTVAICTRDRPDELAQALHSLAEQEYPPQEILVVDNGTLGETETVVREILPRARHLRQQRGGLDIARNRALWATTSEVIAFLDDDAQADPGWVRSVVEGFAATPEAAAVTGLILPLELETPAQELFEANGGFGRGFKRRVLPHDRSRLLGLHAPMVAEVLGAGCGCNMAFRTVVLKDLGGFDEALDAGRPLLGGGDLDMMYRVMRAGHALVYEPRAMVRHRHRRSEAQLAGQLTGHQRLVSAFLVKTMRTDRGRARLAAAMFLGWRLAKNPLRLARRLVGRDVLPAGTIARMFAGTVLALGSYRASRGRTGDWTRSGGARPAGLIAQLSDLWRYRELIWNMTARDLKVKYQRSWLGFLWTLLNPLLTVAVLATVFSLVVRIDIPHYWAFLISGYFAWSFFATTLNGGVQAAVGSAQLSRNAYFPQEVLIVSSALARLLEFLGELAIVMILLGFLHHRGIPVSFVMVLPLIAILFVLVLGISLPIVTLAVYYDDVVQTMPLLTMTLFYLSAVFYPVAMVPEVVRPFFAVNPVAWLVGLYQVVLYQGEMPALPSLVGMTGVATVLGLLGYLVFNRWKREFADIV
jgi:ABC-type polysaccharide/polyol phosphate export permease/GT2 family glycosyltransferase